MIHANSRQPRKGGFSLIEVVIAIAIAGAAFLVLTETFFNILLTLESLESQSDYQKDVRFVRSQVIQIADREELEDGGEITTLNLGEAEWWAEVEETDIVDLFKLDLEIAFDNPDGDPIEWAETLYLLRPTWGDSFERGSLLDEVRRRIEDEAYDRDW